MSNSRIPGPMRATAFTLEVPENLPGPVGTFDGWRSKDSPGSLGVTDWAAFLASELPTAPAAAPRPAMQCACDRDITLAELCAVFTSQHRKVCELYLLHINDTFRHYEISTCLRKAHFLAQIGHESGELTYRAEQLRKGVKESGVYDGYKGRGLIQITWKKNYAAYGRAVHHDFLDAHRTDLEKPEWATDSAGWYWVSGSGKDLNTLADQNDLLAITARVNGGFNGFDDRRRHLASGQTALKVRTCKKASIGIETYRPFPESAIYGSAILSFAWGCWNDPKAAKTGVMRSEVERKQGYKRYLELTEQPSASSAAPAKHHPQAKHHAQAKHHYGFTLAQMQALAVEGSR
jgi:predicted chitinase